jgi:hypothetical protein
MASLPGACSAGRMPTQCAAQPLPGGGGHARRHRMVWLGARSLQAEAGETGHGQRRQWRRGQRLWGIGQSTWLPGRRPCRRRGQVRLRRQRLGI